MILQWYHWAILGITLIVAELVVPASVLVWFGLGALVVAALVAVMPYLYLVPELMIWIAASIAMVMLWFKFFRLRQHRSLSGRSNAEAVGEIGLLITDIAPFGRARVRFQRPLIGSDVWDCIADEKIAAGSRVRVVSVEGSLLKIAPAIPPLQK